MDVCSYGIWWLNDTFTSINTRGRDYPSSCIAKLSEQNHCHTLPAPRTLRPRRESFTPKIRQARHDRYNDLDRDQRKHGENDRKPGRLRRQRPEKDHIKAWTSQAQSSLGCTNSHRAAQRADGDTKHEFMNLEEQIVQRKKNQRQEDDLGRHGPSRRQYGQFRSYLFSLVITQTR